MIPKRAYPDGHKQAKEKDIEDIEKIFNRNIASVRDFSRQRKRRR